VCEIAVPYGKGRLIFRPPVGTEVTCIQPREVPAVSDGRAEVERSLRFPLGRVNLEKLRGARDVVIVVSDKTRPVPNGEILPALLARLQQQGIRDSHITLLVATGAHEPMGPDEFGSILPLEIVERYSVLTHDVADERNLQWVGTTSRGTPVWINRRYLEADVQILVGNVDPHQFVGFTGGAKGVVIGLGGLATIEANHSMMEYPLARMGIDRGNPVREDIDEGGKLVGIDFVINVVLNGQHQIVRAFAGTPEAVAEESRALSLALARAEYDQAADVVIASAGGYPKDINLYQAQKALAHASRIARPGGTVILVAECSQGVGDPLYESQMTEAFSLEDVIDRFRREGFQLGTHKAYLFARDMIKAQTSLVSGLPGQLAKRLFFAPFATLAEALEAALAQQGRTARVAILPEASVVVPVRSGRCAA